MSHNIKLLVFDIFGTVVDWRGSIIKEGEVIWKRGGLDIDWGQFADQWRAGYQPAMDRIRTGEAEWTTIDVLHRQILDDLLMEYNIQHLSAIEKDNLNRIWHRLRPWDDVLEGLSQLRQQFVLTTLSNGNMSLLVHLSKNANLNWDCILSAELARHYKPDLETYYMACNLMAVTPQNALMVASHRGDLLACQKIGMQTAFIRRTLEYGNVNKAEVPDVSFDYVADDFLDLAQQLRS